MKKISIFLLILIPFFSAAQGSFDLKGTVTDKISAYLKEGDEVNLTEIRVTSYQGTNQYNVSAKIINTENKHSARLTAKQLNKISFTPTNSKDFWQIQAIKNSVYQNMSKKGMQYLLRRELEEESIEFVNYAENRNMLFNDSYLESYLYALAYRIYPSRIDDGRPGILNVRILKNLEPNAFIYSNGTMFITTGLISTINSEEELIGIMAHEISHFVLDHSIININKAESRKKKAEFWAAVATGLAAAADVYAATQYDNYTPGILTASTAIIAFSIAADVRERMGLKYSRIQEIEADQSATALMNYIGVDSTALASALNKIKIHATLTGNYLALTGEGSHPALSFRINRIGNTGSFQDPEYDKKISLINSFNASVEFNSQHIVSSAMLAKRNIDAKVATEEDYLLMAKTTMYMYDNDLKNREALEFIIKAKSLNVYPTIDISKQEAIILIRLGKIDEAKKSLEKYHEDLENESQKLEKIKDPRTWAYVNNYLIKEYEWTAKMINKVRQL